MNKYMYPLLIASVLFIFVMSSCKPETIQEEETTYVEKVEQQVPEESQNEEEQQEQNTPEGESEYSSESDNPDVSFSPMKVMTPEVSNELDAIVLSETGEAFNKAANGFALRLLPKLYDGHSFVASPLSIQMALSMTADGALGQTLLEILETLGFQTLDGMNTYSKTLIEQLPAVDLSVKMQLANAAIVNETFPVNASFKEQIESSFYAPVVNMSFISPNKVRETVNEWCKNNTNGLIPAILNEDFGPESIAFLLNALYFKAPWTSPYDPVVQVVKNQPFKTDKKSIGRDYLVSNETLGFYKGDNYRMVCRPLGEKGKYDIAILLPLEESGLNKLLEIIPNLEWRSLVNSCKPTDVFLKLPTFEIESFFNLEQQLRSMGMKIAFSDKAQFEKMFEDGIAGNISKVLHKARIILNDGGIEAASISAVEIICTDDEPGNENNKPIEFFADHPFVYIISERSSGTILFSGVFNGE